VSDGKDWTSSVPTVEFHYLKKIYKFYNAEENILNVHLSDEGHDFGINKRNAVYDFFSSTFGLDKSKLDEKKVTIEPEDQLKSFGKNGELLPKNAIRSFDALSIYFDKNRFADLQSDLSLEKKATEWVASLKLTNHTDAVFLTTLIYNHLKTVKVWHNTHPFTLVPAGINPTTGNLLTDLNRQLIIDSTIPKENHEKLMTGLRKVLSEEQVEAILDKYTVGKVAFTLKGYKAIVPDLTNEEEKAILSYLKQAREESIDFKSMKEISAIFEIYKTKCETYLNNNVRNWRQLFKNYVDKIKAEKAQKK
jgi:hypothetical protein